MYWVADNMLHILLCIGILFNIFWLSEFKSKLNLSTAGVFLLSVLHTLVGVFSVKIFAFLESGSADQMSLYGAVFFMPVVYYFGAKFFKRDIGVVFDIFTICMIFTLMCARVNCLFAGCCQGLPIPGVESTLWPTRQLELIFYVVLIVKLGSKVGKRTCTGTLYPVYMMTYGIFRFFVEWLRESEHLIGIFHVSHIWSIIAFVVGACVYIKILKEKEGKKNRKKEEKKR